MSAVKLADKNIAVVGAARGIGLELVKQLTQKHNKIWATVRDETKERELKQLGSTPAISHVDMTSLSSIQVSACSWL